MNQPHSSSTAPDLHLEREPVCDGSSSDSSSSLNVRTFTIITLVLTMMLGLGEAWRRKMVEARERMETLNNCRQIIISLRLWSPDSTGDYPTHVSDPSRKGDEREVANANEMLRELFKSGTCTDEMIFGGPRSPFHLDGNIGTAPLRKEALEKGENHWAVTWGLANSIPSNFPLVFENPADARMPPRWDADAAGEPKPGRCWADRTVCIGFNDGTVSWMKLEPGSGLRALDRVSFGSGSTKDEVFPTRRPSGEPMRLLQVDQ